jgi:type VI protein secretion system component VasK
VSIAKLAQTTGSAPTMTRSNSLSERRPYIHSSPFQSVINTAPNPATRAPRWKNNATRLTTADGMTRAVPAIASVHATVSNTTSSEVGVGLVCRCFGGGRSADDASC